MCRLTLVPSCLVLSLTFGAATFAADPKPADPKPADAPAIQPTRGRVRVGPDGAIAPQPPPPAKLLKVADGSITVRPAPPTPAKAADAKPADPAKPAKEADAQDAPAAAAAAAAAKDQTYTIDKQRTRVLIGTAMSERMTVTGQRIRMMRYDPGEPADLEAGQFVDVAAGADGVATEVYIVPDPNAPIPGPATVVAVDGKSITVAPAAAPAAAAAAPQKTYKLDPATTRVRITTVTGERKGPGGRITRSQRINKGTTADLKAGQLVRVRARGDLAVSVEVVPPPVAPPARAK